MQEAQMQLESSGNCCRKEGGHRAQRRGECGSSHTHEVKVKAALNPLEILQQRFARGEIDTAEFEEMRCLITNA